MAHISEAFDLSPLFFCFVLTRLVPECVGPLVPAELPSDAVGDGGNKLSPKAQLGAQFESELLWRVLPL